MASFMVTTPPCDYFRVGREHQLPAHERNRRDLIDRRLLQQFEIWQGYEQERKTFESKTKLSVNVADLAILCAFIEWRAIGHPQTESFLEVDWKPVLSLLKEYLGTDRKEAIFPLLSILGLSTVPKLVARLYLRSNASDSKQWLPKTYVECSKISVFDCDSQNTRYQIPLIYATVAPGPRSGELVEYNPTEILPPATNAPRLVLFPQSRFSFIEDEFLQGLYPIPSDQATIMIYKLLLWFQTNSGFYNTLALPFVESGIEKSLSGEGYEYFAAMYPVVNFENAREYRNRKVVERSLREIQKLSSADLPTISRARYSRRYDLCSESRFREERRAANVSPEAVQTGRALFEYSCGDLDTVHLDLKQAIASDGNENDESDRKLLQVEPLWILVFPKSNQVCLYRNETVHDRVESDLQHEWRTSCISGPVTWAHILHHAINKADRYRSTYIPRYRVILARLQIKIYEEKVTETHALVKSLSEFVAELTLLLDPLQAQIDVLRKLLDKSRTSEEKTLFQNIIQDRQMNRDTLAKLQKRADASQKLLFELTNTNNSLLQSELAAKMASETEEQIKLARRAERQNRSILVFTIVTVVFLPLSFFTSYFGMNTSDIRNTTLRQPFFWYIAAPISISVVAVAMLFAFSGRLRWRKRHASATSDVEDMREVSKRE